MSCKVYLSTDDNAPVVSGANSACIINLIKKCLIDGYGDRAPVGGWTMPYANAEGTQAVFRNDHEGGATGFYLLIDAKQPVYGQITQNYYAGAFEGMTSVTDGLFPFGWSNSSKIPKNGGLQSSDRNTAASRAWIVAATRKWLFVNVYYRAAGLPAAADAGTNNNHSCGFWFGDIERWHPDDSFPCMFSVAYGASGFGYTAYNRSDMPGTNTADRYCFARPVNGEIAPFAVQPFIPCPAAGGFIGASGPAYTAQSGLLVGRIAFPDTKPWSLRGWLPDALAPLHPRPFRPFVPVAINGADYLPVPITPYSIYQLEHHGQILFAL